MNRVPSLSQLFPAGSVTPEASAYLSSIAASNEKAEEAPTANRETTSAYEPPIQIEEADYYKLRLLTTEAQLIQAKLMEKQREVSALIEQLQKLNSSAETTRVALTQKYKIDFARANIDENRMVTNAAQCRMKVME